MSCLGGKLSVEFFSFSITQHSQVWSRVDSSVSPNSLAVLLLLQFQTDSSVLSGERQSLGDSFEITRQRLEVGSY